MDRVLDGFTACLNFKLSDRAPPEKMALAEGGTVLFETRSIDTVGGIVRFVLTRPGNLTQAIGLKFKSPTFVILNFDKTISMSVRVGPKVRKFPRLAWPLSITSQRPSKENNSEKNCCLISVRSSKTNQRTYTHGQ